MGAHWKEQLCFGSLKEAKESNLSDLYGYSTKHKLIKHKLLQGIHCFSFQLDETRFVLDANLLREVLEITPIDQAHQFVSPPSGDAITDFVNELGYTEVIHFVSRMAMNNLYQPWRVILSMINQCLTGKTSGHDRPRYPVLQMFWGIITSTNVDYAELMWEEFVQAIQNFLTDKANLGSPTKKGRKDKPHKSTKATPLQKAGKGKVAKVHNVKSSFQLVDEPNEEPAQRKPEPENQGEGEEYDIERAIQMSLELFQAQSQAHVGGMAIRELVAEATRPLPVVEGKGKAIATDEQAAQSLLALHTPKRRSTIDQYAKTGADTDKTNSGEKTDELDQGQARSNPGKTHDSRLPPEQVFIDEDQAGPDPGVSRVALAGPNPEPTHEEFMAQNLDDDYTIGDVFINDKSTKDEPNKLNMESEVVSMVTVLIHQASSSVPPLSTPVIDLSSPSKHVSSANQAPIFIATTTTTTTTLPPPLQQSLPDSEVFTLELRDLPHKIDEAVHESVKEAVHVALQAPLRDP
ncbi:hypothetical protein Tco_1085647 [Tanacetum coccineum]